MMPHPKQLPGQPDIIRQILASEYPIRRIVDIGAGTGAASRAFVDAGFEVTATGFDLASTLRPDLNLSEVANLVEGVDVCDMKEFADGEFCAVWCSHVLEHVEDLGRALAEIRRVLRPGGWAFISVPPFKHAIVGGHLNTGWNVGQLMYRLAVAGFDLREGSFIQHGYNVVGFVGAGHDRPRPDGLRYANGDLELLSADDRFPRGCSLTQGADGSMTAVNWGWKVQPQHSGATVIHSIAPQKKHLRIGLLVPWITQGRGGTEKVGTIVANGLAERGHSVVIHTWDNGTHPPTWSLNSNIALRRHAAGDKEDERQPLLEMAADNLDVLVGFHLSRELLRGVYFAYRLKLPLVLSEHVDPEHTRVHGTFHPREREAALSAADRIHLLTEQFKADLPESLRTRCRVIPNAVAPARRIAKQSPPPGAPYVLLTVARLVPRKQIDLLIQAFAEASPEVGNWELHVVGDGPERAKLVRIAQRCGVGRRVRFLGEQADPYTFYESAQAFCLPSVFEAFPLSVLEALAHGLPVVGFADCSGTNVMIRDGIDGYLASPGDRVSTLADCLRQLFTDNRKREQMASAALMRFDEYRMDRIIDAWEELVVDAARSRNRPAAALDISQETRAQAALLERFERGPFADYLKSPLS